MRLFHLALIATGCSTGTAYAQLGPTIDLTTDGPVAATIAGSTFSWANQAGATVTGNKAQTTLTISQPAHSSTNQAALTSVIATGAACYTTYYQNPDVGSLYNSGMVLENRNTGATTIFQDIYANAGGSNLLVQTETSFQGGSESLLNSYGNNASFLSNEWFFLRVCSDGTNVAFLASPTGAANTFQAILSTTLAALGNPDHIGFFEDANPTGGQNTAGSEVIHRWQATQNNTPQAAAGGGDITNGFITAPNFPVSDTAPVPASGTVPTLPGGLSLAAGATYKAYYDFTPSGNVVNRSALDKDVYFQSMDGNQLSIVGGDGIEGDTASNWSQPRLYTAASAYNLLNFTSSGLNASVTCSMNNTAAGCVQGHIYGTLIRFPTAIQLGDIVHVRMQTGNDPLWYQAFALYAGVEKTPGPGGNPYEQSLSPNPVTDLNCYGEDDILDGYREQPNYPVSGSPWAVGTSLKMGVVPVGAYAANSGGECWKTAPYVQYAANGPKFSYVPAGAQSYITKPVWQIQNDTTYSGMHDYVVELLNDGSNRIRYYFDGYLVATEYYEQSPTNPGWHLELASQTVANFNPELASATNSSGASVVTPNSPISGGSFSATYAKIEVIHGSVSSISQPLDANGASASGDPIGLN